MIQNFPSFLLKHVCLDVAVTSPLQAKFIAKSSSDDGYAAREYFKFKKTNLDVSASLFPALSDPGRVHFNTNVVYYLKVISDLKWNFSFYGSWDSRPPITLPKSDYGTSSGLSWTFGNR